MQAKVRFIGKQGEKLEQTQQASPVVKLLENNLTAIQKLLDSSDPELNKYPLRVAEREIQQSLIELGA